MSFLKKINLFSDYKKYDILLCEYFPFIFFVMGLIIIAAIILTYFISYQYVAPEYVPLIVIIVTVFLLVFDYIIVNSFQGLAEANMVKAEFMRVISHQLRTPLTNSKWTLDLLGDEKDPEQIKSVLEIIKEQNDKMLSIIDDMVFALKIEKGEKPLLEEVDMGLIIDNAVKKFSSLAKSRNVNIKIEKKGKIPRIKIDNAKISKAVENLLENAIQYSKEKEGKVEITLEYKDKKIRVKIKDNGVGIPKEEQKYIFKKFFRSKNILRYQTQGLGLNLCIVRAILQEFGGKIYFKSKEKEGSIFWFELPTK